MKGLDLNGDPEPVLFIPKTGSKRVPSLLLKFYDGEYLFWDVVAETFSLGGRGVRPQNVSFRP